MLGATSHPKFNVYYSPAHTPPLRFSLAGRKLPASLHRPPQDNRMSRLRPKMSDDPESEYNAATGKLLVVFNVYRKRLTPFYPSGRPYVYRYNDVPEAVADTWLDDAGNGEYYNASIRGVYSFTRIN